MPDPETFLRGFNISEKNKYGSYIIKEIDISEKTIVRYNEYSYPIKIIMSWKGNTSPKEEEAKDMIKELRKYVSGDRIIRSKAGRPYRCLFIHPYGEDFTYNLSDLKLIELLCTGHSKRVSEKDVN